MSSRVGSVCALLLCVYVVLFLVDQFDLFLK